MPEFVPVAEAAETPPGQIRGFTVRGRRLAVANVAGEFYAFLAACPHQAGPLEKGQLWGCEVVCPLHHYMFDVRTGENVYPRRVYPPDLAAGLKPLRTYRTRLRGGTVEVEL